jgi:NhaP-type Na+/H+ and K+/H+ antiporter
MTLSKDVSPFSVSNAVTVHASVIRAIWMLFYAYAVSLIVLVVSFKSDTTTECFFSWSVLLVV